MIEPVFSVLVKIAAVYAGCGVIFAALFLLFWCKSFDPSATSGSWGFRVLIFPGVLMLWPVILWKVRVARCGGNAPGPAETPVAPRSLRRNHGFAFAALALIGVLLFLVTLVWPVLRLADWPGGNVIAEPADH